MLLRIKYERLRRGINQTAVAAAASVSASDLGKIERGQYVPPLGSVVLARLSRVLDTPVAELLRPVEMIQDAAAQPSCDIPVSVPPIQPNDSGPTAQQLRARARQAGDVAEADAANAPLAGEMVPQ